MKDRDWTETKMILCNTNGKGNLNCCDWIQLGDWKLSPMLVAESGNMYLDHKDYMHNQQNTWQTKENVNM